MRLLLSNVLSVIIMIGYSNLAISEAVSGKIVIDGKVYSSGSSIIINGGNVIQSSNSNVLNGSGVIISENRRLNTFDNLIVRLAADVDYVSSDTYKVSLTGDDNIVAAISTSIESGSLLIDTKRSFNTQNKLKIIVYGPALLSRIMVNGSSDVNLRGIENQTFAINVEGTGDIQAKGKVRNLKIEVDGSGNVDARLLEADDVTVSVEGAADVTVTANRNLNVLIDGVSNVTYYGRPASITKEIDGVGKVSPGN